MTPDEADRVTNLLRALAYLLAHDEPVRFERSYEGRKGHRSVLTFEVETSLLRQGLREVHDRLDQRERAPD